MQGAARILLIEDDGSLAANLCDVLQEDGFEVVVCSRGDEGLRRAANQESAYARGGIKVQVESKGRLVRKPTPDGSAQLFLHLTADEEECRGTWSTVQVLVCAPHRQVCLPSVQFDRYHTRRVA